ncbi:hypothetical protein [Myxococcus sp. RHSTA-1-4]|uniref:hypothetical protein n=1 Tax=Myxococcus sp. RHSTA-1-4 TaxID=2874601 RepID=UPI001CBBD67B|nr:hypothetical protein [Myxococcus sp. RHSTA-1-4]MBZ4422177.1 hypothetical protein [Myxococcus sp. RHSTA-1-4]
MGGFPLDPELAAFYSRCGGASFASDIYLLRVNDEEEQLEEKAQWWREEWQDRVGVPLLIFGGVASLAYYFATVPGLTDAHGRQPVVQVDTYRLDGPSLLPLASSVDRFFDTYSRYLEELVAHEDFKDQGAAALNFPWKVPHLLARDARLVQLIREGHFDPFLPGLEGRAWVAQVLAAHDLLA